VECGYRPVVHQRRRGRGAQPRLKIRSPRGLSQYRHRERGDRVRDLGGVGALRLGVATVVATLAPLSVYLNPLTLVGLLALLLVALTAFEISHPSHPPAKPVNAPSNP